ncbi:MAG: hypothetical protein ACRCXB_19225 [Aeromonadaceae bacterium]
MQLAILGNQQLTMGTREIAEMLGKRHDNIKASAQRLIESGVILTPALQEFGHRGNTYTEYRMNKRDSLILVAQNCPSSLLSSLIAGRSWKPSRHRQSRAPTQRHCLKLADSHWKLSGKLNNSPSPRPRWSLSINT